MVTPLYIYGCWNCGFVMQRGREMEREEQMVFERRWSSCPEPGENGLLYSLRMLERENCSGAVSYCICVCEQKTVRHLKLIVYT